MAARLRSLGIDRPLVRDYATTFGAELLVVLSALLAYRLVASGYGTTGFATYAVARRGLTLLLPLCVLGLDVAVPRLVAYAMEPRPFVARGYLVASLPIAGTGLGLTTLAILAFPGSLAQILFGSDELAGTVLLLPLLLAGATAHVLVYGHLRGRSHIGQANLLMIANHAVVPLLAIVAGGSLDRVLAGIGIGWLVASGSAFLFADKAVKPALPLTAELARLGLQRVPGDLTQLFFFALPVIVTAQVGGLEEAGIVAFGITALGMVGSSLTPVGFVMLPLAARMIGADAIAQLRSHVWGVLRLIGPLVVLGTLVLEVFAGEIVVRYLGPEFDVATPYLRLILVGAIPWSAFILLRSVVDARHERAVNARNIVIGFLVFALLTAPMLAFGAGVVGMLVAFVVGLCTTGALTAIEGYRVLTSKQLMIGPGAGVLETG